MNAAGEQRSYPSREVNAISYFSSQGPRVDGALKPNIASPGQYILSVRDTYSTMSSTVNFIDNDGIPGGEANYLAMQGTSMATPVTAGCAALILSRNPYLTPQQLYDAIAGTAKADAYVGVAPNIVWGAGKLNVLAAVQSVSHAKGSGMISTTKSSLAFNNNPKTLANGTISAVVYLPDAFDLPTEAADLSVRVDNYEVPFSSLRVKGKTIEVYNDTPKASAKFEDTKNGLQMTLSCQKVSGLFDAVDNTDGVSLYVGCKNLCWLENNSHDQSATGKFTTKSKIELVSSFNYRYNQKNGVAKSANQISVKGFFDWSQLTEEQLSTYDLLYILSAPGYNVPLTDVFNFMIGETPSSAYLLTNVSAARLPPVASAEWKGKSVRTFKRNGEFGVSSAKVDLGKGGFEFSHTGLVAAPWMANHGQLVFTVLLVKTKGTGYDYNVLDTGLIGMDASPILMTDKLQYVRPRQ